MVIFGVIVGVVALEVPQFSTLAESAKSGLFSQDIFFGIMLPPLVYEAALRINFHAIRANARIILFLTFIGVIVSTVLTGYLVASLTTIPLTFALLLGAILSPTDPIAVVDLFKRLHVPEELATIIESESLLNDGVGIVAFVAVSQVIATTSASLTGGPDIVGILGEFAVLLFGGTALGVAFAAVAYLIHRKLDDPNVESAVSVVTAYGSFNLAVALGFSGIICTAMAGIVIGTWVVPTAMTKEVRDTLFSFWSVVVYIVNSLVFLSMGLLVNFSSVLRNILLVLLVLGIVSLARAVFVYIHYPVSKLDSKIDDDDAQSRKKRIPSSWYGAITLSGVRGAIPVVLALTLSQSNLPMPPETRELITSTVIGVALLSITVQSTFASWYMKKKFR